MITNDIKTVESLIDEAESVRLRLEKGELSNSVARTLLVAIKVKLDGFRVNMAASTLGCDVRNHPLHEADRVHAQPSH